MRKLLTFVLTFCIGLTLLYVGGQPDAPTVVPPPVRLLPALAKSHNCEQARQTIQETNSRSWLAYLTSQELEGRMSGKVGNEKAAHFLTNHFQQLGLLPAVQDGYLQSFNIQNLNNFKEQGNGKTANVIAYLPGTDKKSSYIIIGAHLDHLGYGPSMSQTPNRREIHPGADDNASGVIVVMQAAQAFSLLKGQNHHTIVFMGFSGEEMGLLGSTHYVKNPIFPLQQTVLMINMDMVGRLRKQKTVLCAGAGGNPTVRQAVEAAAQEGQYPFRPNLTNDSGGGSDHAPFNKAGIPICFLHTGQHAQYHTPDDTADLIDYAGLTAISQFVFHVAWKMDSLASR